MFFFYIKATIQLKWHKNKMKKNLSLLDIFISFDIEFKLTKLKTAIKTAQITARYK